MLAISFGVQPVFAEAALALFSTTATDSFLRRPRERLIWVIARS